MTALENGFAFHTPRHLVRFEPYHVFFIAGSTMTVLLWDQYFTPASIGCLGINALSADHNSKLLITDPALRSSSQPETNKQSFLLSNSPRLYLALCLPTDTRSCSNTSPTSLLVKHFPELQILIRCCSGQGLSIRTQAAMQHPALMCRYLHVFDQAGITPNGD